MAHKVLHAMYDDEQTLMAAAKKLVSGGVHVTDVYSPFPIHGLDPIIGVKRTRLAIASFMYAMGGMSLALLGMWYFMIYDWPANIGGKPNFTLIQNIPAFVPITFEFSVLCAAHGMAITYLIRNGTLPGMPASNPDPRTTDNTFVMEITTEENPDHDSAVLEGMLKESGIMELSVKETEDIEE